MRIKLPAPRKTRWAADHAACFLCGKKVNLEKDGEHAGQFLYQIEISTKAEWILGEDGATDSQGMFPVGERCYRRVLVPLAQKTARRQENLKIAGELNQRMSGAFFKS